MFTSPLLAAGLATFASSAPVNSQPNHVDPETRATFPFNKIVAFGDDMTDNGQGSYAHGITGNETTEAGAHLWGANTWTDGPVAVSYLAESLGMDIAYDYAFGSQGGGSVIGSVCNNTLLNPQYYNSHAKLLNGNLVPDVLHQIHNYSTRGVFDKEMAQTLHFVWTGNNDMIASIGWSGRFTICDKDNLCHPGQNTFIQQVIACMGGALTNLINHGAKHILVPNVYPRNLSPWMTQYISPEKGMVEDFGDVITRYNSALKTLTNQLNKKHKSNIMYYDAHEFLVEAYNRPNMVQGAAYTDTCVDGCTKQVSTSSSNFNTWFQHTIVDKQPDQWYWMTTVVPSTTVMKALGEDMSAFLKSKF